MRVLHFKQITDDRFDKNIHDLLKKRIADITALLSVPGLSLTVSEPYSVSFSDNEQWRADFYVSKTTKKITWQHVYQLVNSVNSVPYKLITLNY